MGRILKVIGLVAGGLVVLLVVALVAVGLFVDPNDYRDQITAAVDEATGRQFTLEGDLELNLFPRLGIALGGAQLDNADGFGDAPFARFDSAELRIGLLPLLSRRIEIDRVMLSGMRLNLARNAAGVTNWDDLAQGSSDADAAGQADNVDSDGGGASDVEISVAAVEIIDAEVTWRDAVANEDWTLTNFNLTASDFNPGRAFPLDIGFGLNGAEIEVTVEAEMRALVDIAANRYRLDDLRIDLAGEGTGWPGGSGDARLEFASFTADIGEQSLVLEELELEMIGLTVRGNLTGNDFMDSLTLAGGIEIAEFDPRELMTMFNAEIETADPDVLGRASVEAQFFYDASAAGMRDLALRLDDSALTGSAALQGELFEFNLTVDAIDIDRYLPPPADDEELAADTGSVDEVDLPLDRLRNFQANGNLALDEAKFLGLTFNDANFALVAGNGRMTLTPTGGLYGGTIDGSIGIEVQGDAARMTVRQALANVDMAGIGQDYLKTDSLLGTGNVNLDLAAVGSKVGEIKRSLDGTASVSITDGALRGVDIWYQMMRLRAGITGPDVPPLEGEARTTFDRIAVGGVVEDAVMTTDEFSATLPFAALNGSGTIDLLTLELDLSANAGLVDGPTLQQDPVLAEYAGGQIPLRITGTIDAPRVLPDVAGLFSQAAQRAVQEEVDEAVDEASEAVDEAVEEAQDRLRDRLRDQLD